ncbi:PREDICTED: histone deacetylase HDT2-like [Nicotiana attenuata]|uniref:histone deacetylase HDT2-like n=1 Tax=Nicotiana attenuata TaxID=49451 RepID=UPI0009046F32|nr:PREDICTED: histone deacetylase HDT2-like [Nicotiana attenuata]
MTKSNQTFSKAKSSSKPTKSKIEKSKPKKSINSAGNSEPAPAISPPMPTIVTAPSPFVTVTPVVSTPAAPPSPKPITHEPVFSSTIEVSPLEVVEPLSDSPHVESTDAEKEVVTQEKNLEIVADLSVVEGGAEKETWDKESSYGQGKEGEVEEQLGEQVGDSEEEEIGSEGEDDSESDGNKYEKESEGEGTESECEKHNTSEKSEGDGEADSDEDDLPLSEVGKKNRKTPAKHTRPVSWARREVAPFTRTPLTRSKRKVVNEQMIKESRSPKRSRKQIPIAETAVELRRMNMVFP